MISKNLGRRIWIIFFGLFLLPNAFASEITKEDIDICVKNSDCIIVPFKHCCGSTKKAINKKYLDLYNKNKDWQLFKEPICSSMGMCAPDNYIKSSVCVGETHETVKRCVLDRRRVRK